MRQFLALILAGLLVSASLSLAVARGQPGPAGLAVICTGAGVQTVAVDAKGKPVGPAHPCPDGLAALAALAVGAPDLPEGVARRGPVPRGVEAAMPEGRSGPEPRSRGPPGGAA